MNGCIHGGMTGWVKLLRWRRTKRVCLFVCLLLILLGFFVFFISRYVTYSFYSPIPTICRAATSWRNWLM